MRLALAVAAALFLPALQEGPAKSDPAAELKALQAGYQKAEQEYFRAAREGTGRPDPEKHPAREFIPKADDLAQSAAGTETGAQAHLWIIRLAGNVGMRDEAEDSIQALVTEYVKSPALEKLAAGLEYSQGIYGEKFCREILSPSRRIRRTPPRKRPPFSSAASTPCAAIPRRPRRSSSASRRISRRRRTPSGPGDPSSRSTISRSG